MDGQYKAISGVAFATENVKKSRFCNFCILIIFFYVLTFEYIISKIKENVEYFILWATLVRIENTTETWNRNKNKNDDFNTIWR